VLAAVATICTAIFLVAHPYVDWGSLFGDLTPETRREVPNSVLAIALTFLVAVPLQVAQSVQHGLQQGYSATLWTTAGSIVSLLGLLIATAAKASLVPLILCLSGAPQLVTLANFFWFFFYQRRDLRPRFGAVDPTLSLRLLRTGLLFMVLQIAVAFAFTSDNIVVGATFGAAAVPMLAIPGKLFGLIQQFIGMLNGPLWPAFGEAAARGDVAWVRRTLRRTYMLGISAATLASVCCVLSGDWIISLWTGGKVHAGTSVLVPFACWTILFAWGSTVAMFLNGTGRIGVQTLVAIVMAPTAFALKWLLIAKFGVPGVVWATVVAYVTITVGPIFWVQRVALRDLERHAGRARLCQVRP
jgi:O-antigen/teichoic acid export membrane protein